MTCAESLRILEGVRRAGSYKNYVLQDFKGLLRLRSLLARNRARINDQAPEVVARLFGGLPMEKQQAVLRKLGSALMKGKGKGKGPLPGQG